MKIKNIFITGISGCVGHYLFDVLSGRPGTKLYLLLRNPQKVLFSYKNNSQVEIIEDTLQNIDKYNGLLKTMDIVIHLAASWGGKQVFDLNVDRTLSLFAALDPGVCRQVIYFSTASILDENNRLLPAAGREGTDYIKSKYRCFERLPELGIYDKIQTLFPTVILARDDHHPHSHAAKELKKAWKYLSFLRFIKIDGSFHFIHARDIALMVKHLIDHSHPDRVIVPGNPVITVNECLQQLCEMAGKKRRGVIDITNFLVKWLPRLFRKRLSTWDHYSLKKRHFRYKTTDLKALGLSSRLDTLPHCLTHHLGAERRLDGIPS